MSDEKTQKPIDTEWSTGDLLLNAPVAATYAYGGGAMQWRVRRWPGGTAARIEFDCGPVKVSPTETVPGGEWLWAADVSVDDDGFMAITSWNYGPGTWDSRAATIGRAQQELLDQEYRAAFLKRREAERASARAREDAAAVAAMPKNASEEI